MRLPKMAFKQEKHISPTLDHIIHALNGDTLFSKLDLNKGYYQTDQRKVEIDQEKAVDTSLLLQHIKTYFITNDSTLELVQLLNSFKN